MWNICRILFPDWNIPNIWT